MNIVHVCLASSFTENMSYQENLLSAQNALDGHVVTVVTNCSEYNAGKAIYAEPEDRVMDNSVRLIRLEYDKVLNPFISEKVRKVKALYTLIEKLKPDVILFHGLSGWELLSVARYKKQHPNMKLFTDNHADVNNSATNLISNCFLHKGFYRAITQKSLPYIDKVFYLSYDCGDFLKSMYHVPEEKMEFYPLGGTIFSESDIKAKRQKIRRSMGLTDNDILFVHSGKMDKFKRTGEIVKAFSQVASDKISLLLIGSITDDVWEEVETLIEADSRVSFAGWKTADELMEYLCSADVYVQPGGQSATMQNAICCGCTMMLYPHKSHEPYLQGNGYYVKKMEDMKRVFQEIADDPRVLKTMRESSVRIAKELLDYKKLSARLYK